MNLARAVAAQDYRLLAHPRDEVVARVRDLAFMPDKQPRPCEEPLQLLPVNLLVDKDLAADLPGGHVYQTGPVTLFAWCCHGPSLLLDHNETARQ